MTLAHLIICGGLSLLVGFLLGWMRGRRDLRDDTEPALTELTQLLEAIPTHCPCGAKLKARCSADCSSRLAGDNPKGGGA